jgi:hypothetical protein
MSSIVQFSAARGEPATRARIAWLWEEVDEFYSSIFRRQGRKERHQSAESLDVGYGKCPEFVCVDGLIVSKEQADWRGEEEEEEDTEQSMISAQGTLTTLR